MAGGGGGQGGLVQPQPRQALAETGTDGSVPWLLSGGATLVAGGLLFRFGPRVSPRPGVRAG
ncbi:LPXTG cell wall anchor domain-containing protein [Streptacidiphilus sp. 4-A2]|nr:LPXTG cell wall anchor domain-containing protein [Streptacidiphilus sp. 4-A2]